MLRYARFLTTGALLTGLAVFAPTVLRAQTWYVTHQDNNGGNPSILKVNNSGVASIFAALPTAPQGIALLSTGEMYVAGQQNGHIYKISATGTVSDFATTGGTPYGLAVDSSGNIFTANFSGGSIFKINAQGQVSTFASGFSSPLGLAMDSSDNLFVAEQGNNSIKKITSAGVVSTFASGLANSPAGIALDSAGDVFFSNFSTISKITPTGTVSQYATVNRAYGLTYGDNNLYAVGAGTLTQISAPNTTSVISSGLGDVRFLAYQAAAVPEASELVLCSLAGIVLGADLLRRRRTARPNKIRQKVVA